MRLIGSDMRGLASQVATVRLMLRALSRAGSLTHFEMKPNFFVVRRIARRPPYPPCVH
jgi:hypothetical protein